MKKVTVNKLSINKLTVANLGEVRGGDLPDRTYMPNYCLSGKGTCKCVTAQTQVSYCLCPSADPTCLPC